MSPNHEFNSRNVVFVYGLTRNRENTWTWGFNKIKVYWPQALLLKDLLEARLFTFRYDADVVGLWKTASLNTFRDHGKALVKDVSLRRERIDIVSLTQTLYNLVID